MPTELIFPTSTNAVQKTLDSSLASGITASMTLNNVTGIQNKKGLVVIDRVDATGTATPSKREYITFTGISGNTLTGLTRNADGGGSDQDHSVGAVVEFVSDVLQQQAILDGLLQLIDTNGSLDTTKVVDLSTSQVLSNKILTLPQINDTSSDHQYIVAVSELAADRNITLPLLGGDDEFVFKDFIQTLTNKRLTSPKINEDVALTSTATELNLLDGFTALQNTDGWTSAGETWTYASASTITVPAGAASKYSVGDSIRWKQGGAYKYGTISAVADTLLTILVNINYTVANSAITDNYYSHESTPVGFPSYFSYTPLLTGIILGNGVLDFRYIHTGKKIHIKGRFAMGSTSSITGLIGFSVPIAAISDSYSGTMGTILDSGAAFIPCRVWFGTATRLDIYALNASGTYLADSATSSTVPMTWTAPDAVSFELDYIGAF